MAFEAPIFKSSLFDDLTDDEGGFTNTCFMARGPKVDSKTLSHNYDD